MKLRLRFDRVVLSLVRDLRAELEPFVPKGSVVVVTCTAPIRQSGKTSAVVGEKVRAMLAAGKQRMTVTILENRIQVRVLKSAAKKGPKVIGFVYTPGPDPSAIFDVTQAVLASFDGA